MGFAQTAAFFESRAKKALDPEDAHHLREVAGFYRELAGIAPNLQRGSNGARWKSRAIECRTMADHFIDANCREQMMRLAATYDRLGSAAE